MLIPHLHFSGKCCKAMKLYERAFNAIITDCIFNENGGVIHAEMEICSTRVMLNDLDTAKECSKNSSLHLIVTFKSVSELKAAYAKMERGSELIQPMQKTDYSECIVGFTDEFGIRWGFMVEEQ